MTLKINYLPMLMPLFFLLAILSIGIGCNQEGKGFALPEGSAIKGKALFMDFNCNECHSIIDIDWAGNSEGLHVQLGGNVRFKKNYGELVAAVINPSHKIAKQYYGQETANAEGNSKMAIYNEVMTVQELVDIVTFLQSEYKVERPVYYYPMY